MTAKFLIYPSIYEGFGLPVLEAMEQGCPVLASASSSIPEVGRDANVYFDPYNLYSFEKAFSEMERKILVQSSKLKKQCKEIAKEYSWDKFSEKIIQRIDEDLSGKY